MDFRPSEDQKALAQGVRAFCDGRLPIEALHELAKRGGFDRATVGREHTAYERRLRSTRRGFSILHAHRSSKRTRMRSRLSRKCALTSGAAINSLSFLG